MIWLRKIIMAFQIKKKDLKLKDRIYKCSSCGLEIDRDYNASINLEKAQNYKVIA